MFDPFDLVVLPFPFTERSAQRRRPALVLSGAGFNAAQKHLVLAMVTSTEMGWPSDTLIADWRSAGLERQCRVRMKLFTLDQSLVQRRLGFLSTRDRRDVIEKLTSTLALR